MPKLLKISMLALAVAVLMSAGCTPFAYEHGAQQTSNDRHEVSFENYAAEPVTAE